MSDIATTLEKTAGPVPGIEKTFIPGYRIAAIGTRNAWQPKADRGRVRVWRPTVSVSAPLEIINREAQ